MGLIISYEVSTSSCECRQKQSVVVLGRVKDSIKWILMESSQYGSSLPYLFSGNDWAYSELPERDLLQIKSHICDSYSPPSPMLRVTYKEKVELLNPWSFYYIVILSMALKLFHFRLVNVGFNVVTKIRKK